MRLIGFLLASAIALTSSAALAEQFVEQDGLRIHYNALPSNALTAKVAREYGVRRSKARGMVVITVQDANSDFVPATARVSGKTRNLVGQQRELKFRGIREAQAIYYIAEFSFSHMETLRFVLQVSPADSAALIPVEFVQQFYQDP